MGICASDGINSIAIRLISWMIVSVTRDNLRDEFTMADEAFALSPISARAAQPSEADYDAIREAFMETSRGRWFLGEYAKRNRNADTRMVLDAVTRIEETIAAQKQLASNSGLAEALAAIGDAIVEARAAASAAFDNLALEENLAPVRKGARIMREISWRWREIGADGRICDLIDSQVNAIEANCGKISSKDPLGALSAAFDLIEARIEEFGEIDRDAPQANEEAVAPASSDAMPAGAVGEIEAATTTMDSAAVMGAPAMPAEAMARAVDTTAEATDAEAADTRGDAADAYDEALLDMIALEMAAPEPLDGDDPFDANADEFYMAESPPADPDIVAEAPEPIAAPAEPWRIQPSFESSLGSTLIASGIVRRPFAAGPDPLAPIRRMSQAEKIAFLS
jgi:hypothetical protein